MKKELLKEEFNKIMKSHIYKVINYLLNEGVEFGILTRIASVSFEPKLAENIKSKFADITYFILAEYTFQTAVINQNYLTFEAGFGSENYASKVTIPLLAIVQVLINQNPILINLAIDKVPQMLNKEKRIEKSKNLFLSNPKNRDLFTQNKP